MTFVRWSRLFCDVATMVTDSRPDRTIRCVLACLWTDGWERSRRTKGFQRRTAVAFYIENKSNFRDTASLG